MEDLQHFCLRWNNYRNSITTAFENLRDDEDFIDVTLACDGKTLKAHRVVLSACSPYFRELLKSTPCKHPVIVLQDVVFDDLHALVEFIYHGEVNVHQRNLTSFLKTAEVLKVSGLTQQNAAVTATTLPSSAPPILDHYHENLSARFSTRSPSTPSDKMNQFQQHFLYNTNQSQISLVNDENRLAQLQTIRHRRHLRSLTPIRCSQSQDDSPISPKRTKSAENALQSPLSNCSNIFSPSPSTISNDESTSRCKNSCETLSPSHRSSPNKIASPTIANTNRNTNNSMPISTTTATTTTSSSLPSSSPSSSSATTVEIPVNTVTTSKANSPIKYDENHNNYKDKNHSNCEEDIDKDEEEEPPVDFSITSSDSFVKKYNHPENIHRTTSNSSSSPKNLSLKCEPKDEAFGNNSSAAANDHDNFNDDDSNLSEDRLSDQSPPSNVPYPQALLDAEDAFQGHPGYLASLRFNMAAAALAGFNHHQSHTAVAANAVLDGLTAPSQGLKKVFPCLACGKVLCSKASLKRHVADKHASHQEEYRCAICERVYCSRNSLMTHIYTYHKTRPTLLMPPPHHATTSNSLSTDIKF